MTKKNNNNIIPSSNTIDPVTSNQSNSHEVPNNQISNSNTNNSNIPSANINHQVSNSQDVIPFINTAIETSNYPLNNPIKSSQAEEPLKASKKNKETLQRKGIKRIQSSRNLLSLSEKRKNKNFDRKNPKNPQTKIGLKKNKKKDPYSLINTPTIFQTDRKTINQVEIETLKKKISQETTPMYEDEPMINQK